MLTPGLRFDDPEQRRQGVLRWFKVEVGVQVVTLGAILIYVFVMSGRHLHDFSWVAPAAGGLLGSALPLQLAAGSIARASR